MKKTFFAVVCFLVSLCSVPSLRAADAVYTGSSAGSFTNTTRWVDGYVPLAGDTASFLPGGSHELTIPDGLPFTLSAILVNTNGAGITLALRGETNTLVAPATIRVDAGTLAFRTAVLAGTDGLHFSGGGNLALEGTVTNLFTGPVTVAGPANANGGRLILKGDFSFGPPPAVLDPVAVTLSGGMLANADVPAAIAPTRGVILAAEGGHFSGRNVTGGLDVQSPVTGPGAAFIVRQSGVVAFSNPLNDYLGDTVFGSVYYTSGVAASDGARLVLGADGVIPDASRLVFVNGHNGVLDLNGHDETAAGIVSTNAPFALKGAGTLHVPADAAFPLNGSIGAGATLDITSGTARFSDAAHPASEPSAGTLSLPSGATLGFSRAAGLGTATVALNGGGLALEAHAPGLAEYTSKSALNTNQTDFAFSGVYLVPRWANVTDGYGSNLQYLYEGEWYVPAGATYSFGKAFDDGACLIIDGETLIYNNAASAIVVKKDVFLAQGWHTLRLYVGNGTGGVGPRAANGFVSAILYDPANGPITNGLGLAENAYPFSDPGDGSVLRTLPPPAAAAARARLEVNADAAFDRSAAPAAPVVWAADVVTAPGATLTVSGGTEPFTVGSSGRPAVFEAEIDDANGVRFRDKVWVKTLPSALTIDSAADLAVGVPGILGTGPQALVDYSLRIPSPDALGDPAAAPVTVPSGRTLTFDSTTEAGSFLIDDPARAFTASNAVTLAGGTLAFDGPGTVTLGAPVGGNGPLVKLGTGTAVLAQPSGFTGIVTVAAGTLAVLDDAALGDAANPVAVTGGALDLSALSGSFSRDLAVAAGSETAFPDAPFTLTGTLTGTLTKRGGGVLAAEGASPDLDLYVAEGAVTLAADPGPAVRNVLGVDTNATLAFGGTNQISGSVTLTGGAFDLAGNDASVNDFRAYAPSAVTNSAAGTATLTVGAGGAAGLLIGAVAPGVAVVKQGAGGFTLAAVPGTSRPASVNVQGGTLVLGRAPQHVRLTVTKTRTAGQSPRLGELVLTRGGVPLPYRTDASITGSSSQTGYTTSQAIDGSSATFWLANGASGQYITVNLGQQTVFDGYRLYSGTNVTAASSANDPVSWRLELSVDNANWLLADTVTDATLYSNQPGVKIYERTLDPAVWPSVPFDAATPLTVASNATLRAAASAFALDSLSGAGTFEFLRGASAAFGDTSGFTGAFTGAGVLTLAGNTPLDIPSTAVPAAYVGRLWGTSPVYFPPDFPTVRAAASPASAVIGASGSFAGRVLDGAAPAGLIKTGAGKTTLIDAGSAYTGDTRVEAGTLAVNAGAYKFRYIRFNPTKTQNGNVPASGYVLAISEFQLLRNGQPVVWPSGTTASTPYANHTDGPASRAINGAVNDRWLSSVIPNPLTIDTVSGVTFDSYCFYDSAVNLADTPERCPVTWTLEGSDDGSSWTQIDSQTDYPNYPAEHSSPGRIVGTFALRSSPRAWLPAEYRAETPVTNQFVSAVTAEKLCFQVLAARTETTTANNSGSGYSLTALTLLRNGAVVPWPTNTTAWTPAPGWSTAIGNPANLVNNNETATDPNRFYSSTLLNHVVINAHTNLTFDAYRWVTTYNVEGRDPTHWRLYVMPTNGASETFTCVDEQLLPAASIPTARGASVGPFPIRQPAGLNAVDAIPDASRLRVAAGATFELGPGALETVGPLSGTGIVSIATNAVLTLNLFEDAVFDGAFTGAGGTLALSGANAFTCTGAASTPGNFAVDFRGGKFGGTLHVGGALAVAGTPAYALPASLPATVTLFTFGSIDPASRDALVAGAASVIPPAGMAAKVTVTASSATLSVNSPGTIFLLK
jgi:autotransporter-associated beta strand protein